MTKIVINREKTIYRPISEIDEIYFDYLGEKVYSAEKIEKVMGVFVSRPVFADSGFVSWKEVSWVVEKSMGTDAKVYLKSSPTINGLNNADWYGPYLNNNNDISDIKGKILQFIVVLSNDGTYHPWSSSSTLSTSSSSSSFSSSSSSFNYSSSSSESLLNSSTSSISSSSIDSSSSSSSEIYSSSSSSNSSPSSSSDSSSSSTSESSNSSSSSESYGNISTSSSSSSSIDSSSTSSSSFYMDVLPIFHSITLSYLSSSNASKFFTKAFNLGFVPKQVLLTYNGDISEDSLVRFAVSGFDTTDTDDYQFIDPNKIEELSELSLLSTKVKLMMEMIGDAQVPIKIHEIAFMFSGDDSLRLNKHSSSSTSSELYSSSSSSELYSSSSSSS